jgi:hypothetical protein
VSKPPLRIWAVSDGRAGIENQALGLAEAIARQVPAEIEVKRISWPRWMRRTPSRLIPAWPGLLEAGGEGISPPWPDIWIGNGRAAIPLSIGVRRWSQGRTFVVQLQDPLRAPRLFDLVIPPTHDQLTGDNVFPIIGTPHRVTQDRLNSARTEFTAQLDPLPHPRVAVLIGGAAKAYDLSPTRARQMADDIARAISASGGSLMLTFSRRTPADARQILTDRLSGLPGIIWDETPPNPFFAFLGAADAILVTEDSANMPAEAAASGAPVYLLKMDGGQPRRVRFHQDLAARGVSRPFAGAIEHWSYDPLRETERAAAEVLRRRASHKT